MLAFQKMNVLLVDPVSADTLKQCLEDFAFRRVWTAKDSKEALEVVKDNILDLVVSGVRLKPMSGFQLLSHLKENPRTRKVPVLLVVDRKDKTQEDQGMKLGASGFINLPLTQKSVQNTVRQMLETMVDPREEEFLQHMDAARKAARKGDWARAGEGFSAALEIKEDTAARMGRADSCLGGGDLAGAEAEFFAAIRADNDLLRAYLGLAGIYREQNRIADAYRILRAALGAARRGNKPKPVVAEICFRMGELSLLLKSTDQALADFEAACLENPVDLELPVKVGDALTDAGELDASEAFYQKALAKDPTLAHVYNRLGINYRKQNKLDLAMNLYRQALGHLPQDEHLLYNIARCYFDGGRKDHAAKMLKRALAINPEFQEAKTFLAMVEGEN